MRRIAARKLPAKIRQYAEQQQLGSLQRIYEWGAGGTYFVLGAFCFLLGLVLIAAFYYFYELVFSWWPLWQAIPVLLIGVCWIVLGVWLLLTPLITPHTRLYIYSKGLLYAKRQPEVIHWKQVEKFWKEHQSSTRTHRTRYTVQRDDAQTFAFNSYQDELILLENFLDDVIIRRKFPQYITCYHLRKAIDLQTLVLDSQGLQIKQPRRLLPWQDFERIICTEQVLKIYKKNEEHVWASLALAHIPNAAVCQKLITYIQQDIARLQLPQVIAYNTGQTVSFGPLSLSKQGINLHTLQKLLTWNEVAGIGVGENEVIIRHKKTGNAWYALPIWTIEHQPELKELLAHILLNQFL